MAARAERQRKATVVQARLPLPFSPDPYPIGHRLRDLDRSLAMAKAPYGKRGEPLYTKGEWGDVEKIIKTGGFPSLFADTGVDIPVDIYYGLPPYYPDAKAPFPGHVLWIGEGGKIHHEENVVDYLRDQEAGGCEEIGEVRQAILKGFGEINVSSSFQDRLNHLLFLRKQLVESFVYRHNLSIPALLATQVGADEVLLWEIGHRLTTSFPIIWNHIRTKDGPTVIREAQNWRAIIGSCRGSCVHATAEAVAAEIRNRALKLIRIAPYLAAKERCEVLLPQQIDGLSGRRVIDAYEGIVQAVEEMEHVLGDAVILPGFNSLKPPRTTWAGIFPLKAQEPIHGQAL
ncbi:MAG: hypothetical protein Q8N98_03205 [bacterium]|nr:hypothetical protein [bacterium]